MKYRKTSRYRCLLLGGVRALAISLLLAIGIGCRGSRSTDTEVIQPMTTEVTSTECTTTSSQTTTGLKSTTSSTTTTSTIMTELMTVATTTTEKIVYPTTPEIETQPYVVEPQTEAEVQSAGDLPISDREYELLCKIVASEYGGMSDVGERAKIVASVMNQSYRTGQSIENCLYTSCVPWGFCPDNTWYCNGSVYYGDMADAVDYYFANQNTIFGDWQADSWYASGYGTNVFHRQLW